MCTEFCIQSPYKVQACQHEARTSRHWASKSRNDLTQRISWCFVESGWTAIYCNQVFPQKTLWVNNACFGKSAGVSCLKPPGVSCPVLGNHQGFHVRVWKTTRSFMSGFEQPPGVSCPVLKNHQEFHVRFWKTTRSFMSGFEQPPGVSCPVLKNHQEFHTAIFKNECKIVWGQYRPISWKWQALRKQCIFQDLSFEVQNTANFKFHSTIMKPLNLPCIFGSLWFRISNVRWFFFFGIVARNLKFTVFFGVSLEVWILHGFDLQSPVWGCNLKNIKNPIIEHLLDLLMVLWANLHFHLSTDVPPKAANLHQVPHRCNISLGLLLRGKKRKRDWKDLGALMLISKTSLHSIINEPVQFKQLLVLFDT